LQQMRIASNRHEGWHWRTEVLRCSTRTEEVTGRSIGLPELVLTLRYFAEKSQG
jgi:hypothetical protein